MRQVVVRLMPDRRRVRIHWFRRTPDGPVKNPTGEVMSTAGPVTFPGGVGRIACQPKRENILPQQSGGETELVPHSDDPRAVTCDRCMDTPEFKAAMKDLQEILPVG